jgi:hypothetical protein
MLRSSKRDKGKTVPAHDIKLYGEISFNLDPGTRGERVVSLTFRKLHFRGKISRHPLNTKLGGVGIKAR